MFSKALGGRCGGRGCFIVANRFRWRIPLLWMTCGALRTQLSHTASQTDTLNTHTTHAHAHALTHTHARLQAATERSAAHFTRTFTHGATFTHGHCWAAGGEGSHAMGWEAAAPWHAHSLALWRGRESRRERESRLASGRQCASGPRRGETVCRVGEYGVDVWIANISAGFARNRDDAFFCLWLFYWLHIYWIYCLRASIEYYWTLLSHCFVFRVCF